MLQAASIYTKGEGGHWDATGYDRSYDGCCKNITKNAWERTCLTSLQRSRMIVMKKREVDHSLLDKAKINKKDEFYTQLIDIEKEVVHYTKHFRDKVVYCNCDDPEHSNFWKFFYEHFEELGLKRLNATYYGENASFYSYDGDECDYYATARKWRFSRVNECIQILEQSDIVVTNPPFSLFREYISQLDKYDKDFLIISNINAITYKEVFPSDSSK